MSKYEIMMTDKMTIEADADSHEIVVEEYGNVLRLHRNDVLIAELFVEYIYGFIIKDK